MYDEHLTKMILVIKLLAQKIIDLNLLLIKKTKLISKMLNLLSGHFLN